MRTISVEHEASLGWSAAWRKGYRDGKDGAWFLGGWFGRRPTADELDAYRFGFNKGRDARTDD